MTPRPGARFEHARQITGSPKAGTARPVICVVTAVRAGLVYYRPDDGGTRGLWVSDASRFDGVVGRWLDGRAS